MLARVRIDLRAIHTHQPHPHQLQLARQQQYLQKRLRNRLEVLPAKLADDVVVRMGVGADVARADVAVRRALNAPRANYAVGVAANQQRQHHSRLILRRAAAALVDPKTVHRHPLHRREHKMRQVVLGYPLAKVHRQQQRLTRVGFDELLHAAAPPISDTSLLSSDPRPARKFPLLYAAKARQTASRAQAQRSGRRYDHTNC